MATSIVSHETPFHTPKRRGIAAPEAETDFKITGGIISMVSNNKFHGWASEDPLEHLDVFERICSLVRIRGITEDGYKLRLFPFSLADNATNWENSLPPGSITTWESCKASFLTKFFSIQRTAMFRQEISTFHQKLGETLYDAWDRFNSYLMKCPHHGFSKASLLCIIYCGVSPMVRMCLDTGSNGNFLSAEAQAG
ncbi:hypothetical protein V5N11_034304 [Cardamine amara subsp. amara]|uniref:Retrotransposon gag domain-containing protein n=1 Tax=Cardamine amara subsp. amara TaxID=228776 RepID=A0ABD1C261_CARAN